MHDTALLVLVIVMAVSFDFTNGFHDTANAMATSIATGALKPRAAVALSGVCALLLLGCIGWLLLTVYGLIFGAIVGAVFGLLVHAMQGGRRDFSSATVMRPRTYELMVDEAVAADAVRTLGWES